MKFRLSYQGQLLSSGNRNTRAAHKHAIRMHFHEQLKQLWHMHAELADLEAKQFPDYRTAVEGQHGGPFGGPTKSFGELVATHHAAYGHNWLPLVIDNKCLTCSLDILFLRRGAKGAVFNVGDIDGRLKTIFDALAIPRSESGVTAPSAPTAPTFVLLEDDKLISNVTMEADELLEPNAGVPIQEDSRVIITVNVRMTRPNWMSLRFAGD